MGRPLLPTSEPCREGMPSVLGGWVSRAVRQGAGSLTRSRQSGGTRMHHHGLGCEAEKQGTQPRLLRGRGRLSFSASPGRGEAAFRSLGGKRWGLQCSCAPGWLFSLLLPVHSAIFLPIFLPCWLSPQVDHMAADRAPLTTLQTMLPYFQLKEF